MAPRVLLWYSGPIVLVLLIATLSLRFAAVDPRPAPPDAGISRFRQPIFRRTDLIYGTEIGSWIFMEQDYDRHPLIQDLACQRLAQAARISVVRWMPRQPFEDMGGNLSNQAFNNVIDGIRRIGALPLIKFRLDMSNPCASPIDLAWMMEIVRRAGDRVILYDFGNEPNYYCRWSADQYTQEWIRAVPQLKRYARSLGFEIHIGGPVWSNPDLRAIQTFLQGVKVEYARSGEDDLIPSFVSFHTYASHNRNDTDEEILSRIPKYGEFIGVLREESRRIFGFELPVADTEWNFTTDATDPRAQNAAFMRAFTQGMLREFREHGAWLANQFTFASGTGGGQLDMVSLECQPRPMYTAFAEISTSEPYGGPTGLWRLSTE